MLNYIWLVMLASGFLLGIVNGRIDAVARAAIDSAGAAVELGIGLLGIMCLWTGLMAIAEKSGLVNAIANIAGPVLKILFPGISKKHPAMGAIIMNLAANFLGLGNAATPLGLKAMAELQKLNPVKEAATDEMCMFLVLNTAAVQLIPTTIIAVRSAQKSANPAEVIGTIWVASVCAAISGIICAKILAAVKKTGLKRRWR